MIFYRTQTFLRLTMTEVHVQLRAMIHYQLGSTLTVAFLTAPQLTHTHTHTHTDRKCFAWIVRTRGSEEFRARDGRDSRLSR